MAFMKSCQLVQILQIFMAGKNTFRAVLILSAKSFPVFYSVITEGHLSVIIERTDIPLKLSILKN